MKQPSATTRHSPPGLPGWLAVLVAAVVLAPCAALARPASRGPTRATRARVMAHIAASKRIRATNGYRRFLQASRNGFRDLKRSRPRPRPRRFMSGPSPLPHGFVVMGNNTQPPVLIDKSGRALKRHVRRKAAALRMDSTLRPWDKIERIQRLIRGKVRHAGNDLSVETNPNRYTRFNRAMQRRGGLARLGQYLRMGRVVCREFALITQVALQDAGFKARLVRGTIRADGKKVAGHMWNEVRLGGTWRIVDTTNPQFNGADARVARERGTRGGLLWDRSGHLPAVKPHDPAAW